MKFLRISWKKLIIINKKNLKNTKNADFCKIYFRIFDMMWSWFGINKNKYFLTDPGRTNADGQSYIQMQSRPIVNYLYHLHVTKGLFVIPSRSAGELSTPFIVHYQ